jgi:hypothetical protein
MTEIIIRGDNRNAPILPNHPSESNAPVRYDPNIAQDHTGIGFRANPRRGYKSGDPRTDCTILMTNPKELQCPNDGCGSREFRIIADDSSAGASGLVQFVCARPRCKNLWPVLQMGQPQVNDILAQRMGLVIPDLRIMATLGDDDDD